VSPVLDYGFDPLGFLDKLAASKARARLELDGALFEGPARIFLIRSSRAPGQVTFPTKAAQTMRFFVALAKWIRNASTAA
jgi:hypothetical protein